MTITLKEARERAEKATVYIGGVGMGVLVPGGYILTAAQCVDLEEERFGRILLGDATVRVLAPNGKNDLAEAILSICAVDLATDIAVLVLDDQDLSAYIGEYEDWVRRTLPVPISKRRRFGKQPFRIHALCAGGVWVEGWAWPSTYPSPAPQIRLELNGVPVSSQGGPVIDDAGELVSLTPFTDVDEVDEGSLDGLNFNHGRPHIHLALPRWLWERIESAPFWDDDNAQIEAVRAWLMSPTGSLAEVLAMRPEDAHHLRGALLAYVEADDEAARMGTIDVLNNELGALPLVTREALLAQLASLRLLDLMSPHLQSIST